MLHIEQKLYEILNKYMRGSLNIQRYIIDLYLEYIDKIFKDK